MAVWVGKGNGREKTATCGSDGHEMNGWAVSLALHSLSFFLLSPPLVLCCCIVLGRVSWDGSMGWLARGTEGKRLPHAAGTDTR